MIQMAITGLYSMEYSRIWTHNEIEANTLALKGFLGVTDIKIYAGDEKHNKDLYFVR